MKHISIAPIVLILAMLNPVTLLAELPRVTVQISNFANSDGTVEVSLFNSAETFLHEPFLQRSGKVDENGIFSTRFSSLPAGEYALVVVHDANDNGQLDLGFLDFGGEDYAYSNNVRPWFGRPAFDEVKFVVAETDVALEIDMGNH